MFRLLILAGFAVIWASQVDRDLEPVGPKSWKLDEVDVEFKPAVEAWQDAAYEVALEDLEKLIKRKGDEKLEPKELKKAKYLRKIARDAVAAHRVSNAKRYSRKAHEQLRALTVAYRETFAYFMFLDFEEKYRDRGVIPLIDFEPPRLIYRDLPPIQLFEKMAFALREPALPSTTTDPEWVCQGRYASLFTDATEKRDVGPFYPCAYQNWSLEKYLVFHAKLADPKRASLKLYLWTDETAQDYYEIGLNPWKGWKTHTIEFKKTAVRHKASVDKELNWDRIIGIQFATHGGMSDFAVDDIYLFR